MKALSVLGFVGILIGCLTIVFISNVRVNAHAEGRALQPSGQSTHDNTYTFHSSDRISARRVHFYDLCT